VTVTLKAERQRFVICVVAIDYNCDCHFKSGKAAIWEFIYSYKKKEARWLDRWAS